MLALDSSGCSRRACNRGSGSGLSEEAIKTESQMFVEMSSNARLLMGKRSQHRSNPSWSQLTANFQAIPFHFILALLWYNKRAVKLALSSSGYGFVNCVAKWVSFNGPTGAKLRGFRNKSSQRAPVNSESHLKVIHREENFRCSAWKQRTVWYRSLLSGQVCLMKALLDRIDCAAARHNYSTILRTFLTHSHWKRCNVWVPWPKFTSTFIIHENLTRFQTKTFLPTSSKPSKLLESSSFSKCSQFVYFALSVVVAQTLRLAWRWSINPSA